MDTNLMQKLRSVEDSDEKVDFVFSIFNDWLTEEECDGKLFCAEEVNSIERYKEIKVIELMYLGLVADLSSSYKLIMAESGEIDLNSSTLSFNEAYLAASDHVNSGKNLTFYIEEFAVILCLSFDFTIYVYKTRDSEIQKLKDVFITNGFHELTVRRE